MEEEKKRRRGEEEEEGGQREEERKNPTRARGRGEVGTMSRRTKTKASAGFVSTNLRTFSI